MRPAKFEPKVGNQLLALPPECAADPRGFRAQLPLLVVKEVSHNLTPTTANAQVVLLLRLLLSAPAAMTDAVSPFCAAAVH